MSSSPDQPSLTSEDTSMGNTNVAAATSNENTPAEDGTWVVHVRRMNGSTLTYNVNPHTETVADLMDRIHREAEIDPMLQRLIFRGQVISHEPHKHLDEFLTESGQTIHMVVRPVSTLRNATANSSTTPMTAPESATGGGGGGNNDVPPQIGNIFSAMLPPGLLSGSGQFVIPGGVGGNDGAPGSTQVFMHSFHLDPATGQIVGDDHQQQGGAIPLPFGGIFGRSPMPSGATNANPQPPSGDSSTSAPRRSTPTPTTPGPSDQEASNTSTAQAPEPTTTTSGGGNGVQQMISGLSQLFGNLASAGQQPAAAGGGGGSVTATFSTPADGRPSTPPSRPRSQSARLPRGGESSASRSQDGRTRGRVFTRRATRPSATTQQRSTGSGEAVMTDSNRIPVNSQQAPVSRAHGAREEDLQRRAEQTPGLPWRTLIDSDARVDHLMSHLAQLPGPRHYRGSDDLPTFLRNYQRLLLSAAQMVGDVSLMLQSDASRGSDSPPNPQRQDDLAYLARMLAELTDTSEMMVSVVNRTWCDMFDPEGQGQVRTREQEDATQTEGRTSEATEPSAPSLTPYRPTGAAEVDLTSEQGRPSERREEDRQRGVEHVEEAHRSARLTDESVGQEGASEGSTEQARQQHGDGQSSVIRFMPADQDGPSVAHRVEEIDAGEVVLEEPRKVPTGCVIPLPDKVQQPIRGCDEVVAAAGDDGVSGEDANTSKTLTTAEPLCSSEHSSSPSHQHAASQRLSGDPRGTDGEEQAGQPPGGINLEDVNALLGSAAERLSGDHQQLLDLSSELSSRFPELRALLEAATSPSRNDSSHQHDSSQNHEPH